METHLSPRISLDQLLNKVSDPNIPLSDLAPYYRPVQGGAPFSVEIEFNPTLVEGAVRRGQMAVDVFNPHYARRRQRAYEAKVNSSWRGVRLLAEGDSWFQYPDPFGDKDDIVDCLTDFYAIYCTSAAGDTLEHMVEKVGELETLIDRLKPDAFLFSAGGNDVAGPVLRSYLANYVADLKEADFLTAEYSAFRKRLRDTFDGLLAGLTGRFPNLHIFCHGYDWALPRRNGTWLGPQFAARRFPELTWAKIVRRMIDDFNQTMAELATKYSGRVHHIDCRGAIGAITEWRDELHAWDPGCLRVAGRFRNAIDATFPELAKAGLTPRQAFAPVLGALNPRMPTPVPSGQPIPIGVTAASDTRPFEVTNTAPKYAIIEMFGGDNNLDSFIHQDMAEMAAAIDGQTAVIAIADFAHAAASVIEVTPAGPRVLEEWGEIDTGDPEVLSRFLTRALITYPNARKAIGFWDHGTGVFDETDASENLTFRRMASVSRSQRTRSRPQRRLFFPKAKMIGRPQIRAMLHDDTNGGVLTNIEASRMLQVSFEKAGIRDKVDLIFSDTCLNGMIEVLEQLKDFAHCVVGSSDLEPGPGWNYTRWLSLTRDAPPETAEEWARQAVLAFHDEYVSRTELFPCTMGAFRSAASITGSFANVVTAADREGLKGFLSLDQARAGAQGFANRDTYDIEDFAVRLAGMAISPPAVKEAADALADACRQARVDAIALGPMVTNSMGLAFWFPGSRYSFLSTLETYGRLAFDKATGWSAYLSKYR